MCSWCTLSHRLGTSFFHKTLHTGKSSLRLAGCVLGTFLGTGEPLASGHCHCWDRLCLWFLSLQIMPFGSSSCRSVWVSHSPSVTVTLLPVLEVHKQWEEEEVDRCVLFFAAGLENMYPMHVVFLDFPGPLLIFYPSTYPFALKSLKQLWVSSSDLNFSV